MYYFRYVEKLQRNRNFWLLVMYNVTTDRGERCVFSVFNSKDVILSRDSITGKIVAYIHDNEITLEVDHA